MASGVYLHIPFCKSRCSYCDFATDVYKNEQTVERYVKALCTEVEHFTAGTPVIDTIYFGGGTPSLLKPGQLEQILATIHRKFSVASGAEITMEMNPGTVTPEKLAEYKRLGISRASFGVQTFDDTELKRLARGHTADDARHTFRMLRDAGYENISFDLIAGLPRQTLEDWERNLDEAMTMRPEHLSLYLLEIHEGTPLAEQVRSGRQPVPDEELAASMYELMVDKVAAGGYEQYEISNFSKPEFESRHNSKYWLLDPVYGFGVSAHSFNGTDRYANERDTARYVSSIEVKGDAETFRETANPESEFAFLGLRLNKGIDLDEYEKRLGWDLTTRFQEELGALERSGLVQTMGTRLRLTPKGRLYSNEVFRVFV